MVAANISFTLLAPQPCGTLVFTVTPPPGSPRLHQGGATWPPIPPAAGLGHPVAGCPQLSLLACSLDGHPCLPPCLSVSVSHPSWPCASPGLFPHDAHTLGMIPPAGRRAPPQCGLCSQTCERAVRAQAPVRLSHLGVAFISGAHVPTSLSASCSDHAFTPAGSVTITVALSSPLSLSAPFSISPPSFFSLF